MFSRLGLAFVAALSCGLLGTIGAISAEIGADVLKSDDGSSLPIISVVGELLPGDVGRFENVARETSSHAAVIFNSPGGDLESGIGIGRLIRQHGYATVAGDTCASACALAWLAGRHRYASSKSQIGFHVAYVGAELKRESGLGNALVGLYLGELGLGQNVVRYVASAPPESMTWLTFRDAELLGIEITPFGETATASAQPETTHTPAVSPNPQEPILGLEQENAARAIRNAVSRYQDVGLLGLRESSIACWQVVKEKRTLDKVQYCFILDMVGLKLNEAGKNPFSTEGLRHFDTDSRATDLIGGLEVAGVSDPDLAQKVSRLWAAQFGEEFAKLVN